MDLKLLYALEAELPGKPCMLATIVERAGSVPRGVGVSMVVSVEGELTGTVGGGSLEFRVRQDALELLKTGDSALKRYEIHTDEKDVYSGGVTILFRPFSDATGATLCARMKDALEATEERYLVCEISQDRAKESEVLRAEELLSRCALVCPPTQAVFTNSNPQFLIEPLLPAPRVILFGGGHVAQCMARQLGLLEYRVWVVEDRAAFSLPSLFPAAERVIYTDYECAGEKLRLTKRDHAIVMSRGHETDFQILRWLLKEELDYVGCIGSRKKIALLREKLLADGIPQELFDRLHAPIGLSIGSETPAEIAVSVAAELIQHGSCQKSV